MLFLFFIALLMGTQWELIHGIYNQKLAGTFFVGSSPRACFFFFLVLTRRASDNASFNSLVGAGIWGGCTILAYVQSKRRYKQEQKKLLGTTHAGVDTVRDSGVELRTTSE